MNRVKARVAPVAEHYCRNVAHGLNCNVVIELDDVSTVRNAYQFYREGQPIVRITLPLARDLRNDDDLAFVMGHEYGHHIADHIDTRQQAANIGVLIGAAAGTAIAANNDGNQATAVLTGAALGTFVGQRACSQAHEPETDTLATYITRDAGYDPIKGARYFARPADVRQAIGALSFWGRYPPNDQRLATVIAVQPWPLSAGSRQASIGVVWV